MPQAAMSTYEAIFAILQELLPGYTMKLGVLPLLLPDHTISLVDTSYPDERTVFQLLDNGNTQYLGDIAIRDDQLIFFGANVNNKEVLAHLADPDCFNLIARAIQS